MKKRGWGGKGVLFRHTSNNSVKPWLNLHLGLFNHKFYIVILRNDVTKRELEPWPFPNKLQHSFPRKRKVFTSWAWLQYLRQLTLISDGWLVVVLGKGGRVPPSNRCHDGCKGYFPLSCFAGHSTSWWVRLKTLNIYACCFHCWSHPSPQCTGWNGSMWFDKT